MLHKTENKEWIILYDEVIGNNIVKKNQHYLQLHPDDVLYIADLSMIFDNVEARIAASPEVEFEIVQHQKMDGISTYAKLIKHGNN